MKWEMKSNLPFLFFDRLLFVIFFWGIFNKYKKFKQKTKMFFHRPDFPSIFVPRQLR